MHDQCARILSSWRYVIQKFLERPASTGDVELYSFSGCELSECFMLQHLLCLGTFHVTGNRFSYLHNSAAATYQSECSAVNLASKDLDADAALLFHSHSGLL